MAKKQPETRRLDDADLTYHAHVLSQIQAAQAAIDSWSGYLGKKYGLQPNDRVTQDGRIEP